MEWVRPGGTVVLAGSPEVTLGVGVLAVLACMAVAVEAGGAVETVVLAAMVAAAVAAAMAGRAATVRPVW